MGKPIQTQFVDFKERNNLSNAKISQIAFEYANSGPEFARTHFSQKYGISKHVFYRVLEFAIICNLVSPETQAKIFLKLSCNGSLRGGYEAVKKSKEKREKILDLQKEYTEFFNAHVNSFLPAEILEICYEYGICHMLLPEIANKHHTGVRVIQKLLKKGVHILQDMLNAVSRRMNE